MDDHSGPLSRTLYIHDYRTAATLLTVFMTSIHPTENKSSTRLRARDDGLVTTDTPNGGLIAWLQCVGSFLQGPSLRRSRFLADQVMGME